MPVLGSNLVEGVRRAIREELGSEAVKSIPKYVAITFDDGVITQYDVIKNIVEKYRIPVTLFLETDTAGTRIRNVYGAPALAEPENQHKIRELYDTGFVEIGSHTVYHQRLTTVDDATLDYELVESKEFLESLIGSEVVSFAYPYGVFGAREMMYVKKYYRYARGVIGYTYLWMPVRPGNPYAIRLAMSVEYGIPIVPVVFLFHGEPLSVIEPYIRSLTLLGAEFLTFSDFVDAVKRLPMMGIKIHIREHRTNVTSTYNMPLGIFPGNIVELRVISNSPDTTISIESGYRGDVDREFGGFHVSPSTFVYTPSLQQIYDFGGFGLYEVEKWDTTNNVYSVRLRKPFSGMIGPSIVVSPPSGASASIRVVYEVEI